MTITKYAYNLEQLSSHSNNVKEIFLEAMVNEQLITKELAEKMNQHVIVVAERNYFGNFWNKLWKNNKDATLINIVKFIL